MDSKILSIFTRTPLHVGAGNSVGAIDSPIQRERHTKIPVIPGSSLKGVLADLWPTKRLEEDGEIIHKRTDSEAVWLFGSDDPNNASAGALLIGEARVLAFPVRSAKGSFAWITCPLALARYKRDAGANFELPSDELTDDACITSCDGLKLGGKVVLEEYCFNVLPNIDSFGGILADLKDVFDNDDVWGSLGERLVIVSDEIFSYFVENACEVVTRIRVDDETGTVAPRALFNQEQVPSETMFYAVVAAHDRKSDAEKTGAKALDKLAGKLKDANNILQIGGDETIGLGYCSVQMNNVAEGK